MKNLNKLHKNVNLINGVLEFNHDHECDNSDLLDLYFDNEHFIVTVAITEIIDKKRIRLISKKHATQTYGIRKSSSINTDNIK